MKHVVIVGAGVSGLATAYHVRRLACERGVETRVTLLESNSRPGGRVWTERLEGFQVEAGANGFLDSKRSTLTLCRDLGLSGDLIPARSEAKARYLLWNDRLHKVPMRPSELLRTGLLSWRGKLRLVYEAFVPRRRGGEDESVYHFACRRIGREAADVLVDALVTGIHAGDARLLSVRAAFPRMVEIESEFGSLLRAMPKLRRRRLAEEAARRESESLAIPAQLTLATPFTPHQSAPEVAPGTAGLSPGGTLWSLRGGMGQLIETLTQCCEAEIISGVDVRRVMPRDATGWSVETAGQDHWPADAVVLACPSFAQAAIMEFLDPELARLLAAIPYNSLAIVALGFRQSDLPRPLAGFGYLSPQHRRRDVLGVLWNSCIFENRAPDGMALLQAMCGGWSRPEIAGWDEPRLVHAVLQELNQTMGLAVAPAFVRVIRWAHAIPQYHVGHPARVAAIEDRRRQHPHLYLTGNSFRGVSVNDCTEEASRCAEEVMHALGFSGVGLAGFDG